MVTPAPRLPLFVFGCMLLTIVLSIGNAPDADAGAVVPHGLLLETPEGERRRVDVVSRRVFCYVGTWCEFSETWKRCLGDERLGRYLDGYEFVFVFDHSEWPVVEANLRELAGGRIPAEEIDALLARLRAKREGSQVFRPEFLKDLPGSFYFLPEDAGILASDSPAILAVDTGGFTMHPLQWLADIVGAPADVGASVWADHSAAG